MMPLTTLKMRVLAPIATPTVMTAVSANAGLLNRRRRASFTLSETMANLGKFA